MKPWLLLLASALTSCGDMTADEQRRWDALAACAEKAGSLFPGLETLDTPTDRTEIAESPVDIRIGADGHFVWEARNIAAKRTTQFVFVCFGNVQQRRIEGIEVGAVLKRPAAKEVWSF